MKKFLLSALLSVTVALSSFTADASKVNLRILDKFHADFGNISNVEWSVKDDFTKATFIFNNEKVEAFYDANSQLLGTSRAVTIDQMPVNVKRVFAKKYADYTVKETIQFDGVDDTSFYISADNESRSIILHVSQDGGITIFKSAKKN